MPPASPIAASQLQAWVASVCERLGVGAAAAQDTARLLVRTSLRGIDTHGIARLPAYAENLRKGTYRADAQVRVSEQHGALVCDGDAGLGQHVATVALRAAMAKADAQALVGCTIQRCGHLAAPGVIALEAAERGLVAVLCQRTAPLLGLPGFHGRAIGNNPLAFAMPVPGGVPLVFDMAMSEVARGRLADAEREGHTTIPSGWALDEKGDPTTDVRQALAGAMLPAGGHKGMGLAMLVECLAGSLGGYLAEDSYVAGPGGGVTGAFLLVVNPRLLAGQAAFEASVRDWLGRYRKAAGEQGRYPGERQARSEEERLRTGIPVPAALHDELRSLGERVGVTLSSGRLITRNTQDTLAGEPSRGTGFTGAIDCPGRGRRPGYPFSGPPRDEEAVAV